MESLKRLKSIEEATQQLQNIHLQDDARKRGAREMLKRLCRAGKLPESECTED
jgi:hypothetical protein